MRPTQHGELDGLVPCVLEWPEHRLGYWWKALCALYERAQGNTEVLAALLPALSQRCTT